MKRKDSDSDSIYCLANVYLAVLYYTSEKYQKAIDHCTVVTRAHDHSPCSSHVVQCEILPKIDDDVDSMIGLAKLYQSIRTAVLKQQRQPQLVSILTTELFAHCLRIKCQSATECCQFVQMPSETGEFKWYRVCISDTPQLFIGDVLLFLSISRLLKRRHKSFWLNSERSVINKNKCHPSDLVELLQKSAVEHLRAYRQLLAQDFSSLVTIVTTDFEALYVYKHGDYQQCLQLSTQNVHTLLYSVTMPRVPTYPVFIQLMDNDIVSLTALTLIVDSKCREGENPFGSCISQLTLSLYLMTQCQLKLHHSVMSLAQTLDYIRVAQRRCTSDQTLELLTLKLTKRKLEVYMNALL